MKSLSLSTIEGAAESDAKGPTLYAHAVPGAQIELAAQELAEFANALGIYIMYEHNGRWFTIQPDGSYDLTKWNR